MSVERALYARLTAGSPITLLGDRVYPNAAPLGVMVPYLVYARVSATRARSTRGPSGLVAARYQLDIYASTFPNARAVAEAVRKRLDGWRGVLAGPGWSCRVEAVSLVSDQDLYEPEIKPEPLHRVSMDFFVHHREEIA